jgi:hypothetical protein
MVCTFLSFYSCTIFFNNLLASYFSGMTTVEHAIPIPTLYDDVLTLYALSGTGSTPTHIVNYGGVMGEQLVWANRDIPNDPKFVFSNIDFTSSSSCLSFYI